MFNRMQPYRAVAPYVPNERCLSVGETSDLGSGGAILRGSSPLPGIIHSDTSTNVNQVLDVRRQIFSDLLIYFFFCP
jgi:hypothetical protein